MKRFTLMFLAVSLISVAGCSAQRTPASETPEPATRADMQMGMQGMDMAQMMDMHSHMMGDSVIMRHMMGDSAMRVMMQEMGHDDMPMSSGGMVGMDAAARQRMMTRMREQMDAMTPERRQAMMRRMQEAHMRMMALPDVRARMMADPDMRKMMPGGMRDTTARVEH